MAYGKVLYIKHREKIREFLADKGMDLDDDEAMQLCADLLKEWARAIGYCLSNGIEVMWGTNNHNLTKKRFRSKFPLDIHYKSYKNGKRK